jgi:hypothetical protein
VTSSLAAEAPSHEGDIMHIHGNNSLLARAALVIAASLAFGAGACADTDTNPGSGTGTDDTGIDDPAPPPPLTRGFVVGDYIGHISPKARSITFEKIKKAKSSALIGTQDLTGSNDSLNFDNDGVAGSGSVNTAELVTNSTGVDSECPVGYQSNTFCGNVTLRHFYPRPLSYVYVQVSLIRDATGANTIYDHSGLNSDPSDGNLDATFGLWQYTAPAATTPGVLGQSPHNSGSRDWVFANPDNADTWIRLRIVAAVAYTSYMMDFSSQAFVDACSGGTSLGTTASTTQTLPFPFTLYALNSSTVRFNKRAMVTFGSVSGTSTGSNIALPASLAPKPGLFVFWDDITFNSTNSSMCYRTIGSAPNRQYVVTWKNMMFTPAADQPASLTFSAFLNEGTDKIDLVYDTMTSATARADGSSATVGVQNATASAATAEFNTPDFGSGNAYTLVPIP